MALNNRFMRMAALATGVAAGTVTASADDAAAADPKIMLDGQVVSADEVAVNRTLSYALVKQDEDNRDGVTYRVFHDGKSQLYGLVIHGDGHLALSGRPMSGYEELEMYEELRDNFSRTQPDVGDRNVPASYYARKNDLPIGGVESADGFYETGFDRNKGWIGSCTILDPQKIMCLTNVYNDRSSTYTAKFDVYLVDDRGNSASLHSAEYSRPFNSEKESSRYERFVDRGSQGIQHYQR